MPSTQPKQMLVSVVRLSHQGDHHVACMVRWQSPDAQPQGAAWMACPASAAAKVRRRTLGRGLWWWPCLLPLIQQPRLPSLLLLLLLLLLLCLQQDTPLLLSRLVLPSLLLPLQLLLLLLLLMKCL
jgi:hypothetical protein